MVEPALGNGADAKAEAMRQALEDLVRRDVRVGPGRGREKDPEVHAMGRARDDRRFVPNLRFLTLDPVERHKLTFPAGWDLAELEGFAEEAAVGSALADHSSSTTASPPLPSHRQTRIIPSQQWHL